MILGGSLIYQISDTLKRVTVPMIRENRPDRIKNENIPLKRYEAKQRNVADRYIYSYKTYENYRDSSIVAGKWLKNNFGIRQLKDITPSMLQAYYKHRIDKFEKGELSAWTIQADYSAITKLSNATQSRGWIKKKFQVPKNEIDLPIRKLSDRIDRGPYTPEELEIIYDELKDRSPTAAEIIRFSYETGARYEGAINLTDKKVFQQDNKYFVKLIEKGGRERDIEISKEYYDHLQSLISKNNSDSDSSIKYVFKDMTNSNINNHLRSICSEKDIDNRKLHGVRGASAIKYLDQLQDSGLSFEEAVNLTSLFLGHKRKEVINSYINRS